MKKTLPILLNLILDMLPSYLGGKRRELAGTYGGTVEVVSVGRRNEKPGILILKNDRDIEIQATRNIRISSKPDPVHLYQFNELPSSEIHVDAGLNDLLPRIHTLLDTHMDDPCFGIEQLCRAIGISRAQMYRKFSALNGRTLHDYLRSYRLCKARELLLTTDLNVSETACITGFSNLSHFSRIFYEEFGKHPKDYRKKVVFST